MKGNYGKVLGSIFSLAGATVVGGMVYRTFASPAAASQQQAQLQTVTTPTEKVLGDHISKSDCYTHVQRQQASLKLDHILQQQHGIDIRQPGHYLFPIFDNYSADQIGREGVVGIFEFSNSTEIPVLFQIDGNLEVLVQLEEPRPRGSAYEGQHAHIRIPVAPEDTRYRR